MSPHRLPRLLLAPVALATAAVVGFGPAASAEAAACGQPEVPPVYGTFEHPAVFTTVPAVTHLAWRWERLVPTTEVEFSRTVEEARGLWTWSRSVDTIEREYVRTVVDRAGVPAVEEQGHFEPREVTAAVVNTLWEYRQQQTGNTRWEVEGWNAGAGGKGWSPTGATRDDVVTPAVVEQVWVVDRPAVPAVEELTHEERTWVVDGDPAPAGSSPTGATRVAGSVLEDVDLPDGETPAGAGWIRGAWTQTEAAATEEIWLPEGQDAPAGYVATGATRPGTPVHEETPTASATAPAGEGWSVVDGSEETVVDTAAYEVEVRPAWIEKVLLVPGVPATEACPQEPADGSDPVDDGTDGTDGTGGPGGTDDGTDGTGGSTGGEVGGEVDDEVEGEIGGEGLLDGDVVVDQEEGEVAGLADTATADVLPATGAGAEPWMLGMGAASVLAGLGLVRGRGRHAAR